MGCTYGTPITNLNSITEVKSMYPTTTSHHHKSDIVHLKPEQVDTIITTWSKIDNLKEFGLLIMTRLFTHHPDVRARWVFAKDLHQIEEIQSNSQVIYHSIKIVGVFSRIIKNLKSLSQTDLRSLISLGKVHYDYDVKIEDFLHLEECVIYCLGKQFESEINYEDIKTAWKTFFQLIAYQMCEGIEIARTQNDDNSLLKKKNTS